VNFSKLKRQIHREATANPKKAAFLGLMLVVALWFWSPLVWGLIAKKDSSTGLSAAAPPAGQPNIAPIVATVGGNTATDATGIASYSWSQLVRWMDDDRLTLAAKTTDRERDPFLAVVPEKDEVVSDPEEETPADVTPESLGLALSGTIVGSHRRVALINGRPYDKDDAVTLVKDGKEIEFVIEEIDTRRVVLRRNDKLFELRTQRGALSGRIQLAN